MSEINIIGHKLAGKFQITGIIGEGGMATVYRGVPEGTNTEIAVKIMSPDLAKEARFVRRFRREARAAALLKHPNTVQIIEFGVDEGFVFLAMELLQGFDLAMLLHRERQITEARAAQIAIQVCYALTAAHEQKIVHRDLKPDNIMLIKTPAGAKLPVAGMSPNDFVKVLDFGIAKILDNEPGDEPTDARADPITQDKSMLTRVGTIVGTPAYMAPEQGRAEPVDPRTDLYACGVLMYELITGRVPFTGETPMQVVMRHVNEPPRPPSDHAPIHKELEQIIMRALAKYPAQRQGSAAELAFELIALLPRLAGATTAPAKGPAEEVSLQSTLVIEPGPPPRAAPPPVRPAAGAPAPRPAAGAPAKPSAGAAAPGPIGLAPAGSATAPPRPAAAPGAPPAKPSSPAFPTLNIEVPDDLFGPVRDGSGPPTSQAASTNPAPTQRADAPPARSAAPAVPLVRAGDSLLAQTMQSVSTTPVPMSDDDEEAATMIKSPPTDLPGGGAQRSSPAPPERVVAKPEHSAEAPDGFGGLLLDDDVAPELLSAGPEQTRRSSPALDIGRMSEPIDLRALKETVRVDPEETERVMKAALNRAVTKSPDANAALGLAATRASTPPPAAPAPAAPGAEIATMLSLGDGDASPPAAALAAPNTPAPADPAVWQPRPRGLGGATALLAGIIIGAVLVGIALLVVLMLRKS